MDDALLDRLSRSLVKLENLGAKLDDLLFPRQAPPDTAGPGGHPGPKPPIVIPIVDLKVDTEACLHFWATELAASSDVGHPSSKSIEVLAAWTRSKLTDLEAMPWAEQAAIEIIDKAWLVEQTVAPAEDTPIEPPAEGTTRVIASWLQKLGHPLSRTSLRHHMESGHLPYTIDDNGHRIVKLGDALRIAKKNSDQGIYQGAHPVL